MHTKEELQTRPLYHSILSTVTAMGLLLALGCSSLEASLESIGAAEVLAGVLPDDGYRPVQGHIMTRWAKQVSPGNVHREYPRPQMVRKDFRNLNGLWEYAIRPKDEKHPLEYDGKILVPFAVESALSGVGRPVGKENRLWYRRTFEIPEKWNGRRIMLNFGAVDWDATVWINDIKIGSHKGGYDPFSLDITRALSDDGPQEIVVSVWDPINEGTQPRGKQVRKPGGIWYTSVTGIWQTVWLEPVNETHIKSLVIATDIDTQEVLVRVNAENAAGCTFKATATSAGFTASVETSDPDSIKIRIPNARLWSPDSPHLYDLTVTVSKNGKVLDTVESYFGMRKIAVEKDSAGINRLFLNNKPLFQYGPLDQGWWPDGLYTAPTDEALRYDIEMLKKIGCNMLRKHVKVEPDRLYYWCDKLGLMVWQDMPNGDRHVGRRGSDLNRATESAKQFELEWKNIIDALRNHPSIVMWVPFNEGWGQYDTERITKWTKQYDPTRLVNNASGWADRGVGDVHDIHSYPGPAAPPVEENRAAVLGEFGGLGLPVPGHTWQEKKNWGYRKYDSADELTDAYVALLKKLRTLIAGGLSAAVYTQTTDVEIEVNGLMTYDRAVFKMDLKRVTEVNKKLYLPPPVITTVVPTSRNKPVTWRYTTDKPADDWFKSDFDDSSWKQAPGGFGARNTPGAVVRTDWTTKDIWIRRVFQLDSVDFGDLQLSIHHDEDAEVYINGRLAAKTTGYTTSYTTIPIRAEAAGTLAKGANIIAIHCRQTQGGQYIDAGIVGVKEQTPEK